jgi:hypothetical protein
MSKRVPPGGLAAEINSILDDYRESVEETVRETVKDTAKKAVKELKGATVGNAKKYQKGFTSKIESTRYSTEAVIYNAKAPGLTHLLEKGHAKTNGGRTRAFPHISPVNDEVHKEFPEELERKLQK